MKIKLMLCVAFLATTVISAQSKLGTIDSEYIIQNMPESKTVLKLSQAYGAKLDSAFTIKLADFKTRFDDYNTKEKSMGELEKKTVQQELTALDKDIQEYKKNGATLMKLKYDELMRPLYNKLNKTIAQVAKENNFTQILTLTGNEFAYIDTNLDITDLVLKKLGIVIPKQTATDK